ncbi:hypothetical protein [Bacillus sp. LL01]|uniref:hypothetical protein n=1 Tax=Bacillus sp. LL01 TaxID=1665556 RepID=UPI0018E2F06D|nr:hypothetical protein [Bacillus sp. LL01]
MAALHPEMILKRLFSQRLLLYTSKKSAIGLFTRKIGLWIFHKKTRSLDFSQENSVFGFFTRKIGLWIFHKKNRPLDFSRLIYSKIGMYITQCTREKSTTGRDITGD